mmetsp:Transcript_1251/g.2384  ORF Transcript_1251/g.2384 Transcript_1251/m.2384 type:complete len:235 (-) Transcript_1251:1735-2439(-)
MACGSLRSLRTSGSLCCCIEAMTSSVLVRSSTLCTRASILSSLLSNTCTPASSRPSTCRISPTATARSVSSTEALNSRREASSMSVRLLCSSRWRHKASMRSSCSCCFFAPSSCWALTRSASTSSCFSFSTCVSCTLSKVPSNRDTAVLISWNDSEMRSTLPFSSSSFAFRRSSSTRSSSSLSFTLPASSSTFDSTPASLSAMTARSSLRASWFSRVATRSVSCTMYFFSSSHS